MIVNPSLSITLISKLRQNEKLRGRFYEIYEDLLSTYNNSKDDCAQLVDSNKESVNIILSEDLVSVVLSLLLEVDKGALKVLPSLTKQLSNGASNCVRTLKELAYAGGVPLDSQIDSLSQIGNAAQEYKFNRDLQSGYWEREDVQAIEKEVEDEDEKAYEEMINNIRRNLGESDSEDDTQALSQETLSSLASVMATTAKADKTEFDEGDNLPEEVSLDEDELSYVSTTTEAILTRYEMMLRPMLELDSPYGILYKDGLSTIEFDKATNSIKFKQGSSKSVFKIIYDEINKFFKNKLISGNLLNRPTVENVQQANGYNYYPAMMLKFALGFAEGKRHYNWESFKKDAKKEITKRVGVLAKAGLFPQMTRRIQESFSNCILVTTCGNHGSNLVMRICVANVDIDANGLADMLKNNPNLAYFNSQIVVEKVGNDVVDVKIIGDMQALLDVPTWAYQALQKQINSGVQLDSYSGLPIGKSFEGDIIKLTFIPSDDFITVVGAGSRSGKGVTTLSILGAALNSGLGVLYNDFKPDMAQCFWDAEKQFPGLHTFALDGLTMKGRPDKNGKLFSPKEGFPEYANKYRVYGGLIMMLKSIHLMCAVAQYKTEHGDDTPLLWVFDEIQAWQTTLASFAELLNGVSAPKKNEEPNPLYDYSQKILEFIADTDAGIKNYITTTGGKGGVFTLWICQNTDAGAWNNIRVNSGKRQLSLFGAINKAGTMRKILGRGNTIGQYALGGLKGEARFRNQLNYVANNRFFCMFKGSQTDKNTDAHFFKPFLTLNTDDIYDGCWTKGIGKSYGYRPKKDGESDAFYKENVLNKYESTLQNVLPGNNKYGVHAGTGFVGLVGTYCNQDQETIKKGLAAGYNYIDKFLQESGLGQRYSSIEEYLYDFSETGFPSVGDLQDYTKSDVYKESAGGSTEEAEGERGDFTFREADPIEQQEEPINRNTETSSNTGNTQNVGVNENNNNYISENERRINSIADSLFSTGNRENNSTEEASWDAFKNGVNNRAGSDRVQNIDYSSLLNDEDEPVKSQDNPNEQNLTAEQAQVNEVYSKVLERVKSMEQMISSGEVIQDTEESEEDEPVGDINLSTNEDTELKKALEMQAQLRTTIDDLVKIIALAPRANSDFVMEHGNVNVKDVAPQERRDNVMDLNYENAVRSDYNYQKPSFSSFIKQLRGPSYYDSQQFKTILDRVGTRLNLKKIRILELTEDSMAFDNKMIINPDTYNSDYGIPDMIDFKLLFKRLPGLQGINLSQGMFREMLRSNQLGMNAAQAVFDREKDLLRLEYTDPITAKPVVFTRQSLQEEAMRDKMENMKKEQQLREMMQEQSMMNCQGTKSDKHYMSRMKNAAASAVARAKASSTSKYFVPKVAATGIGTVVAFSFAPWLAFGGLAYIGVKKIAALGKV